MLNKPQYILYFSFFKVAIFYFDGSFAHCYTCIIAAQAAIAASSGPYQQDGTH